jgi:hypothetical protein
VQEACAETEKCKADVKSGVEKQSVQWEAYAEERGSARGLD